MKIAVAGLGAMGLWLAGRLLAAGHEVRCFARGVTLEALQREGLRLTFEGRESATPAIPVTNTGFCSSKSARVRVPRGPETVVL